jgi:hypothetical protein
MLSKYKSPLSGGESGEEGIIMEGTSL